MSNIPVPLSQDNTRRAELLFQQDLVSVYRRVERMFIWLLLFEWIAGIAIALFVSPLAWEGAESRVHSHVYAAVFLGGIIVAFPILVARLAPATVWSRHSIAAGQLLFSSLLIHLTGGRLETHFHVFGSLAFLAMFRDWRVLISASIIVAIDHLLRGIYWPASVYNSTTVSPWRWLEHVTWVLFEDGVLIVAIRQSLGEMKAIATRQVALEDASRHAESADCAKGAFLAQMSHEIRTPMTAILGYADLMAIEGDRAEAVNAIRRNGQHLLRVLDDILDLSKIEAEQMRVQSIPTNVAELLRDAQHLLNTRATQRSIGLSLELQNVPHSVLVDPVRLRQIVLNLASNAIKFTAKGHVRLIAEYFAEESDEGSLKISVADTGIGLTAEQCARLFKPFSQADDSHHRMYGGTGLGLIISRRLAMIMGGDLTVSSQPNVGSTFTLSIPVRRTEKSAAPTRRIAEPQPDDVAAPTSGVGKRILVVDDAADNRRLLRRLLVHGGFEVDVADDGSTAIPAVLAAGNDDHPYDLILMDILMPNIDGYEATRQLRAQGHRGLIFALTGNASPTEEERCLTAGCDAYLTKPFDCEVLLKHLQKAVNAKQPATPVSFS